jgi:hypothetical protein
LVCTVEGCLDAVGDEMECHVALHLEWGRAWSVTTNTGTW